MKKHCVTKRSPGCGSQRLLRCRSHPAGRGPNSSSLFPPLAAVVAVASGLTGTTMTVSPTKRKAPLEVATPRGFFLFGVTILTLDIPDFRIPDPPQKSSAVQKVYRAGFAAEGRPVLVQPLSLTPFDSSPSRGASGETVHFAGTAKASPCRRGGIASAVTERLYEGGSLPYTPGTSSLRASSRRAVPSGRSLAASIWPGETW